MDNAWVHCHSRARIIRARPFQSLFFMNIKPLNGRIVVLPLQVESKTKSGLFIPDTAKDKPNQGRVLAVAAPKAGEPALCQVGDMVLYNRHSGSEIEVDGRGCLILHGTELLAILSEAVSPPALSSE